MYHFLGHYDLDLFFYNYLVKIISSILFEVGTISSILFEVGIPNLVYVCFFGWWSVVYHLQVTVTLTLFLDNCLWNIMPIFFEVVIPNLVCGFLWDVGVVQTILGHFDLDIDF